MASKDPPHKKRKRWVDGKLEYFPHTGTIKLFQIDDSKRETLVGTSTYRAGGIESGQEFAFESGWICEVESEIKSAVICLDEEEEVVVATPQQQQPYAPPLQFQQRLHVAPPPVEPIAPPPMMPVATTASKRRRRTDEEIIALFD